MRRLLPLVLAVSALGALGAGVAGTGSRAAPPPPPSSAGATPVALGVAVGRQALDDPRARALLRGFGSVTPENAMKMDVLQPRRGRWAFAEADALVTAASRRGQEVRGHTLIWHRQLPAWVTGRSWTRPELLAVLRAHVRTVVGHFRGRVVEWDVVNEPLSEDGRLRESLWLRVIGPSYIDEALAAAREADPGARLVINEFNAERPGPKRDALEALIRRLLVRRTPVDGVGLQGHVSTGWHPTLSQLTAAMGAFTGLGLGVTVTELDVATHTRPLPAPERLARQAEIYGMYGSACASTPGCRGVTVWGLTDDRSWLGAEARALPFDRDYSPKPAWEALLAALGSSVSSVTTSSPIGGTPPR